jgi:hypothetical protein
VGIEPMGSITGTNGNFSEKRILPSQPIKI